MATFPGFDPRLSTFGDDQNQDQFGSDFQTDKFSRELGDIAMTRGQARNIIDRFTNEAIKKNITPQAYMEGLYELGEVGRSPDFTRSQIRNALRTPGASVFAGSPDAAKQFLEAFSSQIPGINPATVRKQSGAIIDILQQLKKDNLIRSNVTQEEIESKVQKPFYGALQDWLKTRGRSAEVGGVLQRSTLGSNIGGSVKSSRDLAPMLLRDISGFGK